MYNFNINIKGIASKEEYCLLFPNLSSSHSLRILRSVFIELFPNQDPQERSMHDLIVNMLGLNNIAWEPPAKVYQDQPAQDVLAGDIPLHLFDKVMQTVSVTDIETKQGNTAVLSEIVALDWKADTIEEHEKTDKDFPEVDTKIVKVDISKFILPRGSDAECSVCGKKFPSGVYLRRHFFNHSHSKEKPHYCRICDQWIVDKNQFQNHQAFHKKRYFACILYYT